ncbi:MAG: hypothetical protein R3C11_02960 [Planctomycetaceae bacterium]
MNSAAPRFLMCPPDYFRIEYEINPWMHKEDQNDHENSIAQWKALHKVLEKIGCQIAEVKPVEGLPDLVFTANAALVFEKGIYLPLPACSSTRRRTGFR